jgi:hypothetical protein
MGYAPLSLIAVAPDPEDSGTVLQVSQDSGDRFPAPPFTYLAWPSQTIPKLGVDSEEGTVVSIDADTFTLVRPANAVPLTDGMQFSAFKIMPNYSIEETVTITEIFPATDTGVVLNVQSPGGAVSQETLTEAVVDAGSAYTASFEAEESGVWHYGFTSDQRVHPEQDFFIRFSEVL